MQLIKIAATTVVILFLLSSKSLALTPAEKEKGCRLLYQLYNATYDIGRDKGVMQCAEIAVNALVIVERIHKSEYRGILTQFVSPIIAEGCVDGQFGGPRMPLFIFRSKYCPK